MSITLVAIDGVGRDTELYLQLLRSCLAAVEGSVARLLTSDSDAHLDAKNRPDRAVECVTIEPLDRFAYSRFCVEELTAHVETDHALMVQLDGFVVNPSCWSEDFLAYDYIGGPWRSTRKRPIAAGFEVGNGGFSLRSKRFLEACAELRWTRDWPGAGIPEKYHGNEDYFLCVLQRRELEAKGIRFAPLEVAQRFSIQAGDSFGPGHRLGSAYGYHGKKWIHAAAGKARRHGLSYPHAAQMPKPWWQIF